MLNDINEMKSKGNIEGLFTLLQDDKDDSEEGWMSRLDTAEALAQLGDKRGLDYLKQMAESPNKEIQEVAVEILDELKNYQPEPVVQSNDFSQPRPNGLVYKINSRYPYLAAWTAFIVLYLLAVIALNPVATLFLVVTQNWLSGLISSLLLFLLFLVIGFFIFRFVIRKVILPFENKL